MEKTRKQSINTQETNLNTPCGISFYAADDFINTVDIQAQKIRCMISDIIEDCLNPLETVTDRTDKSAVLQRVFCEAKRANCKAWIIYEALDLLEDEMKSIKDTVYKKAE